MKSTDAQRALHETLASWRKGFGGGMLPFDEFYWKALKVGKSPAEAQALGVDAILERFIEAATVALDALPESLDDLSEKWRNAEIRFQAGDEEKRARVVGVTTSLPLEMGGRDEPALVVWCEQRIGHVYPHEVNSAYREERGGRRIIQ